jgi:hypothetical protein
MGLLTTLAPACSSTQDDEGDEDDGALTSTEVSKAGEWIVDMKAVKKLYCGGSACTSKYFFGLSPKEAGLCKEDAQCAAMEQQGAIVWDQAFRFNQDHTPVAPTATMPVVKLEGASKATSLQGQRLNIIPMLKETDPLDQKHIASWMQNGDIQVYFHPEMTDQKGQMDRRTSHTAMYIEVKDAQGHVVERHHIDNPNDYGPQFNHSPDRQMPFHIFRYQPKGMSAEQSKKWGLSARNWALITDDLSPFADFFDLKLQSVADLRNFRDKALAGKDIPEVYCSGLAYTNLNLGINYPLKANMLRAQGYERESSGNVGANAYKADTLAPAETQDLQQANPEHLVYEPYTAGELATAYVDNTFALLPPTAAEGKPSRKAIVMNPQLQAAIVQGFSELQFSDAEMSEKPRPQRNDQNPVATPGRVKAWADAYALPASETEAWLARNEEVAAQVRDEHIDTAGKTPVQVLRAVEIQVIKNRFVGPRIWLDEADHRQWAPDPRMLAGLVQKPDVDLVYVGTVINCELLVAADGSAKDACKGFGGKLREWKEGGADTSTYPHYAVPNGHERTHRRFDASPFSMGKEEGREIAARSMGSGTQVTVRATTKEAKDIMFVFHTPEMNEALSSDFKSLSVKDYDKACTKLYADNLQSPHGGTCVPTKGVLLELKDSREVKRHQSEGTGQLWDETFSFDILGQNGVCQATSDTKMKCPIAERTADGWKKTGDSVEVSRLIGKEKNKAFVSITMVDKGAVTTGEEMDNCPACKDGGAHFNQWTIKVRDD